jgi:hypothetical protein
MCSSGHRTNKAKYSAAELYELCLDWSQWRSLSFPKWDQHEIENEAFVIASALLKQYDHKRASLRKFLDIRLYEPMRRSYAKSVGMKITREKFDDNTYGKRIFKTMFFCSGNVSELQNLERKFVEFKYPSDLPIFPPKMREVVQLLAQGKNQRETADILGVTEGAVSLRVKAIRQYLLDQQKMGFSHW